MNRRQFLRLAAASGLMSHLGCEADMATLLPGRQSPDIDLSGTRLLTRFAHISDTHVIDTLSPARFPAAQVITRSAWRPWEAYSTQILDGILRTLNRTHASGRSIDFLLHSGDTCDNAHGTELDLLFGLFDGVPINPLTGPDDRPIETRPPATMDPYSPFTPTGLYRQGLHGNQPSIPWYALPGNHDAFAVGVFPYFDLPTGRVVPLPVVPGSHIVFPAVLDPTGSIGFGNVSPARPGPPNLQLPSYVQPNPDRAYFEKSRFRQRLSETLSGPIGHGFSGEDDAPNWYSVSPVPGLRLIGLDSGDQVHRIPGFVYADGCISPAQLAFLRRELDAARGAGEIVVVATHHPSAAFQGVYAGAVTPESFRSMLNEYPNVTLHLCGHMHRNRVADRGGYLEIETCSTIDPPQEGRLIEIHVNDLTGEATIAYEMFSHVQETLPPLGDDPLLAMRQEALAISLADSGSAVRQKLFDPSGTDPTGMVADRSAVRALRGA